MHTNDASVSFFKLFSMFEVHKSHHASFQYRMTEFVNFGISLQMSDCLGAKHLNYWVWVFMRGFREL